MLPVDGTMFVKGTGHGLAQAMAIATVVSFLITMLKYFLTFTESVRRSKLINEPVKEFTVIISTIICQVRLIFSPKTLYYKVTYLIHLKNKTSR